jgi:hypothetical protein
VNRAAGRRQALIATWRSQRNQLRNCTGMKPWSTTALRIAAYRFHRCFFPSTEGYHLDVRNVRRLFSAICSPAGLEGFRLCELRQTCASLMAILDADPRQMQRQLGHESLAITLRYYSHWILGEANMNCAPLIEQRPKSLARPPVSEIRLVNIAFRLCLQRRSEEDDKVDRSFGINGWAQQDLNLQPADYEPDPLGFTTSSFQDTY